MFKHKKYLRLKLITFLLLSFAHTKTLNATAYTWNGAVPNTPDSMSDPNGWTQYGIPASGDTETIPSIGGLATAPGTTRNLNFGPISFSTGAPTMTIGPDGNLVVDGNVSSATSSTIQVGGGVSTAYLILNGQASGSGTMNYNLVGNGNLEVSGGGQVPLTTAIVTMTNGLNALTIDTHPATLTNVSSLVSTDNIYLSAPLTITNTSASTIAGLIQGTSSLTKSGTYALELTNTSNSYSGGTTVNAGILKIPTMGAVGGLTGGALNLSGAAIQWTGNDAGTNRTQSNSIVFTGLATTNFLDTQTFSVILNDTITGTGFSKVGAGTLTLTDSANTYTGGTNLLGGSLQVPELSAVSTGTLSINGTAGTPAILVWSGTDTGTRTSANVIALTGPASGSTNGFNINGQTVTVNDTITDGASAGGLTIFGGGTLTLGGNPNTYTGGTNLTGATTVSVPTLADFGTGPLNINDATIQWNNTDVGVAPTINNAITLTGVAASNILNTNTNTVTIQQLIKGAGGFSCEGGGTLILTNTSNTYTLGTAITNSGTLEIPNMGAVGGLSGGALRINGGTIEWSGNDSGTTRTSANSIVLTGLATTNFINTNGHNVTINDTISGVGGGFSKTGAGILTLTNPSNHYSGNTNINSGATLQIPLLSAIGTGVLALNDGILLWSASDAGTRLSTNSITLTSTNTLNTNSNTIVINDLISGLGSFELTGGGTLTLVNPLNSYSGGTTVTSGTLDISIDSVLGNSTGALILNGGTAQWIASDNTSIRPISVTASSILNLQGYNVSLGGNIIGSNALSISATGGNSLILAGTNSGYTGTITLPANFILQGTSTATSIPNVSIITQASTTTLEFSQGIPVTYSGILSGPGGLTIDAGTTVTLNSANTYFGDTHVKEFGTVITSADSHLGDSSSHLHLNSGTLEASGSFSSSRTITLTGTANSINTNGYTITLDGPQIAGQIIDGITPGGFTKTGAGTLTLINTANRYSGGTTIQTGTVQFAHDTALGNSLAPLTFDGGTAQWTNNDNTTTRPIDVTNNGGILSLQAFNITLNSPISGSGPLAMTGSNAPNTLVLTNNNSGYTGDISLAANFILQGTSNPYSIPNSNIAMAASSTTLQFSQGTASPAIYGKILSGPGLLLIDNATTVILSGLNTYTGNTDVIQSSTVAVSSENNLGDQASILLLNSGTLQTTAAFHNRLIELGGTNNFINVPNGTVIFNSQMTDYTSSGGFTKLGAGTMVLTNTNNTYTGGTTIADGCGTIAGSSYNFPTNALISIHGTGNTAGTLDFTQTSNGTFSGTLLGTGNITTAGSTSTLTLDTNNKTFTGNTYIPSGILQLTNTAWLGGNVNLNGGIITGVGTLGNFGSGTVAVSSGMIHPGNSPGILTIAGDYIQTGGILATDINKQGNLPGINCGTLEVGGSAILTTDGHVLVTSEDGLFAINGLYPIIQTEFGVVGKLSQEVFAMNALTASPLLVNPVLTYDSFNVYLNFQIPLLALTDNDNEYNVLQQFFTLTNPTEEQQALIDTLITLDRTSFQKALNDLSGSQYAQLLSSTELSNNQYLRRLYEPLRPILGSYPSRAWPNCFEPSFEFWTAGSYGISHIDNSNHEYGFKTHNTEITAGAHLQLTPSFIIGLSGTLERSNTHFNIGGYNQGQTILGGLYFASSHRNYYIFGDLIGGGSSNTLKRSFTIGSTTYHERGKPNSLQGAAYLEAGVNFMYDSSYIIQPFLGLQFGYYNFKSLTEIGDDLVGLYLKPRSYGSTKARAGVHLSTFNLPCGLTFGLDLAWVCLWDDFQHTRIMHFKEFGNPFKIKGSDMSSNSFDGSLNATEKFSDNFSLYVTCHLTMRQYETAYHLISGLSLDW